MTEGTFSKFLLMCCLDDDISKKMLTSRYNRSDNGVKNRWNTSVRKNVKAMEQLVKSLHLQGPGQLQGFVTPTATHPDLMVERNHNPEQSEEEEFFQSGFKSYSKVVLHNSPPNAQR
jgi:hypothetical protein